MSFLSEIRVQAAAQLRQKELQTSTALILCAALSFAVRLLREFSERISFQFTGSGDIVSWISEHQYPKQQEFVFYFLALIGVPFLSAVIWVICASVCALIAKKRKWAFAGVYKKVAFAVLPLLGAWYQIHLPERNNIYGLLVPLLLCIFSVTIVYFLKSTAAEDNRDSLMQRTSTEIFTLRRSILWEIISWVFIPLLLYAHFYNSRVDGSIDMYHEGERLAPLQTTLDGGLPYQDVYVQHGLLRNYYIPKLASDFFGPSVESVRRINRMLEPLAYICLYFLGMVVFPRGGVLLALILIFISSGNNFWVVPRQGIGLLSTAFLASYFFGAARNYKFILAGLVSGFAFWYSVEYGLYSIASGTAFLFLLVMSRRGRFHGGGIAALVYYWFGILLGASPFAIYLHTLGVIPQVLENVYIQCEYQLITWGLAFPSLDTVFAPLVESGVIAGMREFLLSEAFRMYSTVIVLVLGLVYLLYRVLSGNFWQARGCAVLLLLLISGAAYFRTALGRSDIGHWIDGSTYLWVLVLLPFDRVFGRVFDSLTKLNMSWKKRFGVLVRNTWLLVPIVLLSWYVVQVHDPVWAFKRRLSMTARPAHAEQVVRAGGIRLPESHAQHLRKVVSFIQENTSEGEFIYDFSNQGSYYFLANRSSATKYFHAAYAPTLDLQEEVIIMLEHYKVRLVIFKAGGAFDSIDGVPNTRRQHLIAKYLEKNFQLVGEIKGTHILMRK